MDRYRLIIFLFTPPSQCFNSFSFMVFFVYNNIFTGRSNIELQLTKPQPLLGEKKNRRDRRPLSGSGEHTVEAKKNCRPQKGSGRVDLADDMSLRYTTTVRCNSYRGRINFHTLDEVNFPKKKVSDLN